MDMDFGKLFEMFEERFGRFAATALLLTVALAVAATSVHFIWVYFISPVGAFGIDYYGYLTGHKDALTRQSIFKFLLASASGLIALGLYLALAYGYFLPAFKRRARRMAAMCDAHCRTNHEELRQAAKTLAEDLVNARRAGIDVEHALGEIKSGPLLEVCRRELEPHDHPQPAS